MPLKVILTNFTPTIGITEITKKDYESQMFSREWRHFMNIELGFAFVFGLSCVSEVVMRRRRNRIPSFICCK